MTTTKPVHMRSKRRSYRRLPAFAQGGTRHVVNWQLLFGSLVGVSIFVVATSLWLEVQQRRSVGIFLTRAAELEAEGRWDEAARYLFQYLAVRPDDAAALSRVARAYDSSRNDTSRAIELYYQAIGLADSKDRQTLKCRLVEMLFAEGRYVEAETEAQELLGDRFDPLGQKVVALAILQQFRRGQLAATGRNSQVVGQTLEAAVRRNPEDVELATEWAEILLSGPSMLTADQSKMYGSQSDRAAESRNVIDRLIEANPRNPRAWLARFNYRRAQQDTGAEEDLLAALQHGPRDVEVLAAAAEHYCHLADSLSETGADAAALYRQSLQHHRGIAEVSPTTAAYDAMGDLLITLGEPTEAVSVWRGGLAKLPAGDARAALHGKLAEQLLDQNELAEADSSLQHFERYQEHLDAKFDRESRAAWSRRASLLRAQWHFKSGEPQLAIPYCESVIEATARPVADRLRAWRVLADCYAAIGQWDQSALCYEEAVDVDRGHQRQRLAAAHAWMKARQPGKAVAHLEIVMREDKSLAIAQRMAHAQLIEQIDLPANRRDWRPFLQLLDAMRGMDGPRPWVTGLLESDHLVMQAFEGTDSQQKQRLNRARDILQKLEQQYGTSAAFRRELVQRYERLGLPELADRALAGDQRRPRVEAALTAAQLQLSRGNHTAAQTILQEALDTLPVEHHQLLRKALVKTVLVAGDPEQAMQEFNRLQPLDTALARQLGDLFLKNGQLDLLTELETTLRDSLGLDASVLYFEARRLLDEVSGAADPKIGQVLAMQARIASQRPAWPAAYVLKAEAERKREGIGRAIEAYQAAIRLGERRAVIYEELIAMLFDLGRLAEAERYLAQLQVNSSTYGSLPTLTDPASLEGDNFRGSNTLLVEQRERRRSVVGGSNRQTDLATPARLSFARHSSPAVPSVRDAQSTCPQEQTQLAIIHTTISGLRVAHSREVGFAVAPQARHQRI